MNNNQHFTPRVIYASSKDPDMFYAAKTDIHDPFFYLDIGDIKFVFLDLRDYGVFVEENVDPSIQAVLLNSIWRELGELDVETTPTNKLALYLFTKYGLGKREIEVPASFPLDMADFLRIQGFKLKPAVPFFPERARKNETEIRYIRECVNATYDAFKVIEKLLSESQEKDGYLLYGGEKLTSEILKFEADIALFGNSMIAIDEMTVASGKDSAIPHHLGSGPILPGTPIVCDIYPRHRRSGFHADLTRTYVKGAPQARLEKMYEVVLEAQQKAIKTVRPGIPASEVHQVCVEVFKRYGFETGESGFIHGTGHGIGLEIHEAPSVNSTSGDILMPGNVITIEPGLYYPDIGGVRIEDDILVTENGYENLTDYPKKFEL